CLQFNSDPPSF
nr:immunoglobulin light chain junction region [Macaca mulatta]